MPLTGRKEHGMTITIDDATRILTEQGYGNEIDSTSDTDDDGNECGTVRGWNSAESDTDESVGMLISLESGDIYMLDCDGVGENESSDNASRYL